uniref:IPT/TIG domain-containing protein n=1 Tax=Fibrocapsa japonica TaxID=94617 RepID=A0A7S2V835_9STRA
MNPLSSSEAPSVLHTERENSREYSDSARRSYSRQNSGAGGDKLSASRYGRNIIRNFSRQSPVYIYCKAPAFDWDDQGASVCGSRVGSLDTSRTGDDAKDAGDGDDASVVSGTSLASGKSTRRNSKEPPPMQLSATILVALNGVDYSPHAASFMYYKDPIIKSLTPPLGSTGGDLEVRLEGKGLFEGRNIMIRGVSNPDKGKTGQFDVPGEFVDENVPHVLFTLPPLPKDEYQAPLSIYMSMDGGNNFSSRAFTYPFK